ncbi:HAD hydrolase family protein [Kytococcus sedentarius]|uniref:HAD-superfamily hydrolase, subfamily IIB n=1 Tax=Kytococcus sedentarius (strain ATCC 14392 / DSM 20547 / JCM 11482 / CCUG 33030 / NBRC 15357 / NCTC 11040 / CCM 314 / 541) TaxID=478801 RepID=C7NJ33_KYTSD|nr:HAD hydrolase family protein [Kytococcus sedentarius]ACV05258.1 HAD-superfamily hydrolase, subfamily IIB [Kytococcus sedentarius DSM 20547]QQB63717.1 HAD hydrolase family protein [Kytococcus sedentarius]STX13335.1 Putative hydrolase M6_Spy0533 [Kytococcus sedentarius]
MTGATRPLMVCLDLDGTTIDYDSVLHPEVRDAVLATSAAGHTVLIATGRTLMATLPLARELELTTGYLVCSNGAVVVRLHPELPDGHEIVEKVTFDPGPALALLREHLPGAFVAAEVIGVGHRISEGFPQDLLQGELTLASWEELGSEPVTRLTFHDPGGTEQEFLDAIDDIGLHGVNYSVGYTAWLDLAPEGVSKASALEGVRRWLGVEPGDTLAVGDQRNDLEMLDWAARGVAMGQAPAEVLAAADEVTGHVDDHGLAQVLRSLEGVEAVLDR